MLLLIAAAVHGNILKSRHRVARSRRIEKVFVRVAFRKVLDHGVFKTRRRGMNLGHERKHCCFRRIRRRKIRRTIFILVTACLWLVKRRDVVEIKGGLELSRNVL